MLDLCHSKIDAYYIKVLLLLLLSCLLIFIVDFIRAIAFQKL